jgi:aspartate/methionine/tyrosine aminotransferase
MRIAEFELERFFARHEFAVRHLLCASDVEGWRMADLLDAPTPRLAGCGRLTLGYTEAPGHPLLRAEIASLYETIAADEVLTFSGAEEAIYVAANVLLGRATTRSSPGPRTRACHEVAAATGADVTLHELHASEGWAIDVAAAAGAGDAAHAADRRQRAAQPDRDAPRRGDLPRGRGDRRRGGRDAVQRRGLPVPRGRPATRLPAGADLGRHGVSLGVMSKSFAMAGLRIGWLATHDRGLLERAARYKDYLTICSSAPSEILALIALRARDEVIAGSRADHRAEPRPPRRVLRAPGSPPQPGSGRAGGSIGFPELTADTPIDAFAQNLLDAEGVLLAPGSLFGHPGNHFRIGFGRTGFDDGLARFEAYVERTLG